MRNNKHHIAINWQKRHGKLRAPAVRHCAQQILAWERHQPHEVSLLLCGDEHIIELNRQYRHKNQPTDVLSFESGESDSGFLGDMAISLDTTETQSVMYGVSFEDEFKRLLIHGILHLLGYDHERSPEEKRLMEFREDWIFREVNQIRLC